MHSLRRRLAALVAQVVPGLLAAPFLLSPLLSHPALADTQASAVPPGWALGVPKPWEIGMQASHSIVKTQIIELHDLLMVIITLITLFVAALLGYVLWRYSAKRNPVPSRTSHHTWLEVGWTVLPVLILVVIAIPSFRLVYFEDRTPKPDLTVKVIGHQWYWEYGYPDQGNLTIESRIVTDDQLKPGQKRLLEVDEPLVVPAGKNVRILSTSADVIHSFFIPSLGVQRYAIPGRTIETWLRAEQPGAYYGECNQICGTNHSMMPIVVHALAEPDFQTWAAKTKAKQAARDGAPERLAQAAGTTGGTELAEVRH